MSVFLERDGDGISLTAPLVRAERAEEIPGHKYDKRTGVWRYPLSWATCVVARAVFGDDLEVGPELAAWAAEERRVRIDPLMKLRRSDG